jgi:uncharacterized protein
MEKRISGGMLYSAVECPHRVFLDATQDHSLRDEPNAFVEMLWEHGLAHEASIVEEMGASLEDLSQLSGDEKAAATRQAMDAGVELIYSGRIEFDDMVGEPDLLRKTPGGYVAGDIKSGRGMEGGDENEEGKPKLHYAMQLAHYVHILEKTGRGTGQREGFIVDRDGDEISYDLDLPIWGREKKTSWDRYVELLSEIRGMLSGARVTQGALASVCGLCHWHTYCSEELGRMDDLTLIPELGRAKRDVMATEIRTVKALATVNISTFVKGSKTEFKGIGPDSLTKFQERAKLLSTTDAAPYLKQAHELPDTPLEVFFDVETDPMRNLCYLHGYYIVDIETAKTEYKSFFMRANTPEEEQAAFAGSWDLLSWAMSQGAVYVYSPYERTTMRALARKYPDVVSEEVVSELFARPTMIDLYTDVVRKKTEWPLRNHSIKTLAKYLGFSWRDINPSGAASIEWYHRWVDTGDAAIAERILQYNEDDCVATKVLLDGIRKLPIRA